MIQSTSTTSSPAEWQALPRLQQKVTLSAKTVLSMLLDATQAIPSNAIRPRIGEDTRRTAPEPFGDPGQGYGGARPGRRPAAPRVHRSRRSAATRALENSPRTRGRTWLFRAFRVAGGCVAESLLDPNPDSTRIDRLDSKEVLLAKGKVGIYHCRVRTGSSRETERKAIQRRHHAYWVGALRAGY